MPTMTDKVTLEIASGPILARDDDGWEHNEYGVVLVYQGRRHSFPWKQGLGITDDPSAASVLESLFLDASGYGNAADFEDWAAQYGYDEDSRRAEALYHEVGRQTQKLAHLFGVNDYDLAEWMGNVDAEELAAKYAA